MPGELTCNRDGDDRASLAAGLEGVPAVVEPAGALVGASPDRSRLTLSAPLERRARAQRTTLVPGSLNEQPARVRVAGLRNRAQTAALARRVLARRQTEEGAEALRPETPPVTELNRQPERGQGRDTAQTDEPADDLGEGGSAASSAIARSSVSRRPFACSIAP